MVSAQESRLRSMDNLQIGSETPTRAPFCKERPMLSTKFPSIIPIAIARKIHKAKYLSRIPRFLNIDVGSSLSAEGESCGNFSMSLIWPGAPPRHSPISVSAAEADITGLEYQNNAVDIDRDKQHLRSYNNAFV